MIDLQWNREFALEQSGDDEEILAELLDLLRSSGATDLDGIKSGLESGDAKGAADAAHSIKGAAASMGIETLRQVAYEIEMAGRNGDLDSIRERIPVMEAMIAQLDQLQ